MNRRVDRSGRAWPDRVMSFDSAVSPATRFDCRSVEYLAVRRPPLQAPQCAMVRMALFGIPLASRRAMPRDTSVSAPEVHSNIRLSSWKEIAAYLRCGV